MRRAYIQDRGICLGAARRAGAAAALATGAAPAALAAVAFAAGASGIAAAGDGGEAGAITARNGVAGEGAAISSEAAVAAARGTVSESGQGSSVCVPADINVLNLAQARAFVRSTCLSPQFF